MNIFYILIVLMIFLSMLLAPAAALATAQAALMSWWSKVLPALLPFFIISELFSRLGLIRLLGVWLTPIMQPLFRLPGAAAIALLLGFFSGSPTGGAITAQLRRDRLISRQEGLRLLAFCNNAGPLYLLITISALLGCPTAGLVLAAVQYPINLAFGVLLRFIAPRLPQAKNRAVISPVDLIRSGIAELRRTPVQPLSLLLKESSLSALGNIAMIGAFMLFFSLLLLSLKFFHIDKMFLPLFTLICRLFDIPSAAAPALFDGLFEMTLGIQALSDSELSLFNKILAASIILGWSGLSIHLQIAGIAAGSDLTQKYYLPCRAIHALLAPTILILLKNRISLNSSTQAISSLPPWLLHPVTMLAPAVLLLFALFLLSLIRCSALWLLHRRKTHSLP